MFFGSLFFLFQHLHSNRSVTVCTCILVIRNMMPPTASRERAGKSRLDKADGKRQKECGKGGYEASTVDDDGLRRNQCKQRCFSPGVANASIKVAKV